MKYTISFALSLFIFISIYAQKRQAVFAGAGVGLDHGGLGLKVEYQPFKYLGLFGGVGHNLVGFNGNGGLIYNILPKKNFTPVATVMLGVNASIVVDYQDQQGQSTGRKGKALYEGFTVGGGFDVKLGRKKNQKLNFMLLVPLRHGGFYWARNYIIQNGGTIKQDVYPVLLATGWNINLLDL